MHLVDIKDAAKKKAAVVIAEKLAKLASGQLEKLKPAANAAKLKAAFAKARTAIEKALKAAPKDADLLKIMKALDKAKATVDDNIKAAKDVERLAGDVKDLVKEKDVKSAVQAIKALHMACTSVGKAANEDKDVLTALSAAATEAAKSVKDSAAKTALTDLAAVAKAIASACGVVGKVAPEIDKLALSGLKVLT